MRIWLPGLLLMLFLSTTVQAETWGPWDDPLPEPERSPSASAELSVLKYGLDVFRRYISPVDGPRCPMLPTCSSYAEQALDKHGPWLGIMLTVDRLLHESDPREHRHPVQGPDRIRYRDPLEDNDFWLAVPQR